jgi:hypothetical protein
VDDSSVGSDRSDVKGSEVRSLRYVDDDGIGPEEESKSASVVGPASAAELLIAM